MECKQCGKSVTEEELHRVADWVFCAECFGRLMEKTSRPPEASVEASDGVAGGDSSEAAAVARCSLCEKPIDPATAKDLGVWKFCADCMDGLARRPDPPRPDPESGAVAPDEGEPESPRIRTHVQMDVRRTIFCDGCGRQIPEHGSRGTDGKRLCPECFYGDPGGSDDPVPAEPEAGEGPAGEPIAPKASADQAKAPADDGPIRCECCDRPILSFPTETVEGYFLCRPCLTTDADAALEIARNRHKIRLKQLKTQI